MEGFDREIMEMLDELHRMKYRQKADRGYEAKADKYGYSFEPFDAFRMDPLGFPETAVKLQTEAAEMFELIRIINRHSPLFGRLCRVLEKMIAQLGSCCITKAVLEQEGASFRLLDHLTIEWLRGMLAFNFRKCYSAFIEVRGRNGFNFGALEVSVRLAALDRRLTATAEKIERIRSGQVRTDLSEDKNMAARADPDPEKGEQTGAASFEMSARALPVDKAAVRETLAENEAAVRPVVSAPGAEAVPSSGTLRKSTASAAAEPRPAEKGAVFCPVRGGRPDAEGTDLSEDPFGEDLPYVSDDLVRRMSDFYRIRVPEEACEDVP